MSQLYRILLLFKPDDDIYIAFQSAIEMLSERDIEIIIEKSAFEQLQIDNEAGNFGCGKLNDTKEVVSMKYKNVLIRKMDENMLRTIDLVITLGGDGLVMFCNTLFGDTSNGVPPVMSFDLGSLGFLAPFNFADFEYEVRLILIVIMLIVTI
jgi:NAD kinase